MSITTLRHTLTRMVMAGAVFGAVSCGDVSRTGRSPSYLIIDLIEGSSGADDEFGTFLLSDVETLVSQTINGQQVRVPTIFNDNGRATLRIGLKNIGAPTAPLGPTSLNDVTLTRYRVVFRRADGRNTPGVDVPHGFDGGLTITIAGTATVQVAFELVRHTMKLEPPLRNLVGRGSANQINTIAEITFYGRDQTGHEVIGSGLISVNFGDFGDPSS